jgi:molybdenum cofactor biosynthesis enzyme MoaA
MSLEEIGFYTLSDVRVKQVSSESPMWRCELILTDRCNFNCPYCRGLKKGLEGDMPLERAKFIIDVWSKNGLKNIRFSGGEPTLYPYLVELVEYCREKGVERIAVSTNGSNKWELYNRLVTAGVNDFSISLDACCSSTGDIMAGNKKGVWNKVVENIKQLSKVTYVTLGVVLTPETLKTVADITKFGSSLGVADIRIISAAQSNDALPIEDIPLELLKKHPILKYRVNHFKTGRKVRGIQKTDSHRCGLVVDDSAVVGQYHFPCIIYLREQGAPIGKVSQNMREERIKWAKNHDCFKDPICKNNCLDVCIDYNNKYRDCHE